MPTKTRGRLAGVVVVMAVAALAALLAAIFFLIRGISGLALPGQSQLTDVKAVVLEDTWSSYFTQAHTRQEQEAYLASTLTEAKNLGANTVLLTGSTPQGTLLARGLGEDAPAVAAQVEASDAFLSTFDPVRLLTRQAAQQGMQVALYCPAGTAAKDWMTAAAQRYGLPLYQAAGQESQPLTYSAGEGQPVLLRMDDSPALLAAIFQAQPGSGIVLGDLAALVSDASNAAVTLQFLSGGELPDIAALPVPQTLAFASPDPANKVYSDTIYLMGTSDPSQPLTLNGQEVERQGVLGIWGVEAPIVEGDNLFTAQQGQTSVSITLTRPAPSGSSGGSGPSGGEIPSDGSVPAQWGQKVRVTSTLASQLSDYTNTGSITMTAYQGAVAEVADSVSFVSGGKRTYAYQLHNGSFLLAKDCELLEPGTPDAAFSAMAHSTDSNIEYLNLAGSGTPFYTHSWEGNDFTLHFYSASYDGLPPQDIGFAGATVAVEAEEHGFAVHITFSDEDPLWGYHVDYLEDGTTRIALKHQPKRSDDPARPLEGVTVLLDPGHGGDDMGAPGSPLEGFPQEDALNLSAALAAKYRLEQLGAAVTMTRDTDVFYTLGERMEMLNQQKPDFFIAVHHNSVPLDQDLSQIGGTEAYWFYTEGRPLAENLSAAVSTATGRNDRGPKYNSFYVTRSNICPAVLLELGFVGNPTEYESCASLTGLWTEGGAIAQAVLNSLGG